MDRYEEIQKSKNVVVESAKLVLKYRHFNLDLAFHIITSEQVTLATDITDHIVENHTSVQDHITIKPKTFTMKGLISEKVYVHPDSLEIDMPEEPWNAKLAKLAILAPTVSSYVYSAINATEAVANKINQIGGKIANVTNFGIKKILKFLGYKPSVKLTHNKWSKEMDQLTWITFLDTFRINRIPVALQTGWGDYYENMYITDITVNQGDTYQQSELSVTVKELRFTDIKLVELTQEKYNRYVQQNKDFTNTVTGQTESNLYKYTIKGYGGYS